MQLSRKWEEWAVKQQKLLSLSALIMGLACLLGRRVLYATSVDGTGLLTAGTALEWGTYLLSALALVLFAAASRRAEETPDSVTALGQLIGAVGIGWTALRYPGEMPGLLGNLWKILGILSALCLICTAYCTKNGKAPNFLFLLPPCLFWLTHLVDNYRGWSGQPQLQSYLFSLLATMAMALFTYYTAADSVGLGKPRIRCFSALSAGFLCLAAMLPGPEKNQLLFFTSALWAVSDL